MPQSYPHDPSWVAEFQAYVAAEIERRRQLDQAPETPVSSKTQKSEPLLRRLFKPLFSLKI